MVQKLPETEVLHKWSYRTLKSILIHWSKKIVIQRSCASGLTGTWKVSWYSVPKGARNRGLPQVVLQDPEKYPDTLVQKNRDTEILGKWSYRNLKSILIQRSKKSWHSDLAQVVLQDPDTSGPKGSSYRSSYKCRANLPSLLVGVHSHTHAVWGLLPIFFIFFFELL